MNSSPLHFAGFIQLVIQSSGYKIISVWFSPCVVKNAITPQWVLTLTVPFERRCFWMLDILAFFQVQKWEEKHKWLNNLPFLNSPLTTAVNFIQTSIISLLLNNWIMTKPQDFNQELLPYFQSTLTQLWALKKFTNDWCIIGVKTTFFSDEFLSSFVSVCQRFPSSDADDVSPVFGGIIIWAERW